MVNDLLENVNRRFIVLFLTLIVISLTAFSQTISAIQIGPRFPDCGGDICGAVDKAKNEVIKKPVEKLVKETGNAIEDLKNVASTGKCGGDICDALEQCKKGCR